MRWKKTHIKNERNERKKSQPVKKHEKGFSPFFLVFSVFSLHQSFHSQWKRECVCFFGSLMCLQFDTHIFYDCIYWWWEFLIYRLGFGRWSVWLCGTFHWFRWFFFHYSFVNCALKIHIKGVNQYACHQL